MYSNNTHKQAMANAITAGNSDKEISSLKDVCVCVCVCVFTALTKSKVD